MKWRQALLRLILFVGSGSFLTLLSGFYVREPTPLFLDAAPTEYRRLQFGFPLPIFHSSVELWSGGHVNFDVAFMWVGALLDIAFYASVVGVVFLNGSEIVRRVKARKS